MFWNLKWIPLATVLALGVAACSDGGGTGLSGTDFDPQAAEQATENLQARLNSDSDILISLELVSAGLSEAAAASVVLPNELDRAVAPLSAQMLRDYTLSGSAVEPIFPVNLLGVTFVWSTDLGQYVPGEGTDAPLNGVRFVLYAIDPLTRLPAEPLNETGFVDLIDNGDATATRLAIYAESGGTALVDYSIEATYSLLGAEDISVTVIAEGYISDGQEQLDFLLDQTATFLGSTQTLGLDVSYTLSLAGENVSVSMDISGEFDFSGEQPIDAVTAELTIRNGSEFLVEFEMTVTADNTMTGVINFNGAPAMYISGTEADPVFERADGEPLTEADIAALLELYDLLDDIFDVAEHLFEPFGETGL
jgi:hypothetical protein